MAFTIYTVSDPATVGSALSAMAMFFGQDDWVASAIKTGLMLSLIFILAQGVTRNGLRLDVMVVQVIVVWAMFMPKTTVTVEQFDNAAPPRVVDDVPYAIALPASMAGAFALYMTNKIEAVMVNVDGDYLSVSGDSHPFTPARALMAITMCPSDPMSCADQNLVESMRLASRYCASGKLANTDFKISGNVLQAFADTLELAGQTIVFDATNPYIPGGGGGRAVSCADAASHFLSVAQNERDGVGSISKAINGLANRAEIKKYSSSARAAAQTERTWDDSLNDINRLRDSNSKMDSLAFANVTLYALADTMKFSANAPLDQAISIRRDTSLFEWAKSESQQSMLVSTTAPKFMDILFFVFIASTPIVMFIVAANPQGGLKVAGSYVLFGMWTQSWIPMMAIVMSWYQTEIRNMVSPAQFTPEYMAFFMRHAYTTTIAASNMIQQSPYLMFAIMTGSMFALSGMVSKAMPSGKGDSSAALKGGAGGGGSGADVLNPGSPKGAIPGAGMSHAIRGGMAAMQSGMTSSGVGVSGDGSAALPGIAKLDTAGSVQGGSSLQKEQSAAARQSIQSQSQQAHSELSQLVESAAKKMGGARLAQNMTNAGVQTSYDAKTGQLVTQYGSFDVGSSQTNSKGQDAKMQAGVSFDTGKQALGKVAALATGVSAGAQISGAISEAVKQDVKASNANGFKSDSSAGSTQGTSVSNGSSASSGTTGTSGAEYGDTASKAKSLQNTFSKLASQSDSLDKADKAVQQAGQTASASVGQQIDGGQVVSNWSAQAKNHFGSNTGNDGEAASRVQGLANSALTPSQQIALSQGTAAEMQRMDKNQSSIGLSRDQVAMGAAWSTLANMAATASTPQEKISAQLGMAQLAKSAGAADMTQGLKAVSDSLNTVADVNKNLASMGQKVQPAVQAATQGVDAKLSTGATSEFGKQVSARMSAHKNEANSLLGGANSGLASVTAQGEAARTSSEQSIAAVQAQKQDMSPLVNATERSLTNQSGAPQGHDISQFGAGNNTSINHKLMGNPGDGKNDGSIGASGSGGVVPSQTLPGALSGGLLAGSQIAGEAVKMLNKAGGEATGALSGATLSGAASAGLETARTVTSSAGSAISGATAMVGDTAKAIGSESSAGQIAAPSTGNSSTTTVIMQGGSGSGLPSLGLEGGLNLNNSGGGGGPAAAPTSSTSPSSKPYAAANAASKGGAKSKTPTARR